MVSKQNKWASENPSKESAKAVYPAFRPKEPEPRVVRATDFSPPVQFRIHVANIANVIMSNEQVFSPSVVRDADVLLERCQVIGVRDRDKPTHHQLLDRNAPIVAVDIGASISELEENAPKYKEFIEEARKELKRAIREKRTELRAGSFVDFWDPKQRDELRYFTHDHSTSALSLAEKTAFANKKDLLLWVDLHAKAPARDFDLIDCRKGMGLFEALQAHLKEIRGAKQMGREESVFRNAYINLKEKLLS